MLLHLRQESDTLQNSNPLSSLKFAAFERPGDPSSILTTQLGEVLNISDDGWFGHEEVPSHRLQGVGLSPVEV